MRTKTGKDVPIDQLTAETYIVPKGEERVYHLLQEVKQYDPKTGVKLSTARIQKYPRRFIEGTGLAELRKLGYDIKILHNPKEWAADQAEVLKAKAAEEEARKQAEFDAKVEAKVAEALKAKAAEEAKEKNKK